jgi:hypothetical protein
LDRGKIEELISALKGLSPRTEVEKESVRKAINYAGYPFRWPYDIRSYEPAKNKSSGGRDSLPTHLTRIR